MKKIFALVMCLALALSAVSLAEENKTVFDTLSNLEWTFTSGAGGWSTDLTILPDGAFTGSYHDSEMGETGEGYPNGSVYVCSFSGQLSDAGEENGARKIRVDRLEKEELQEYIEDGIRYVPSEVYGISEGDEMILYAPGTPVSVLGEEMQLWAHVLDQETPPVELEDWFLMSEKNNSGFVGYPAVGMANPWLDLTAEELAARSGIAFNVPEGAEDVIYRYLPAEQLAEMQFKLDGDDFCARVQPAQLEEGEILNISGMYFAWDNQENVTVKGCTGFIGQAQTGTEDWAEICSWYDAAQGMQYCLSVSTTDPDGLDPVALAEQIF